MSTNSAQAAARSMADARRTHDSAARARRRASPSSRGTAAAVCISSSRPVAVEHDIAAGRDRGRGALAQGAAHACMERSSVINNPSNPIEPRITSRTYCRRNCRRRDRIDRGKHNMGGHRHRQPGGRAELGCAVIAAPRHTTFGRSGHLASYGLFALAKRCADSQPLLPQHAVR